MLPESLHSLKSLAQNAVSQRQAAPPGFMEVGQIQERSSASGVMMGQKQDANVTPLLGLAPSRGDSNGGKQECQLR